MISKRASDAVMLATGLAYIFSVFARGSLAVAAIPAADRFQVSASALGALVVFQVLVYASMQIPVGILLDRFGPRILLVTGAILMSIGQFIVAQAEVINFAYLGRMLVGIGDAATFVSMIRLVQDWNDSKRAGKLQLFMTNIGQLGQIIAVIPFAILLAFAGWQSAFNVAAMIALLSGLTVFFFIRTDSPPGISHHDGLSIKQSAKQLLVNMKFSGARMCFWIMFVSQSSGMVFALFWGVPFLIKGQGQSPQFAVFMLFIQFAFVVLVGLLLGIVTANRKNWRIRIFVWTGIGQIICWMSLALIPGRAPVWFLVVVVASISIGAPVSMIAMDFSRHIIPPERRGSANGFINVGGHAATFLMMTLAGWTLDVVHSISGASSPFTFQGFRWAMATQILVLLLGLAMFAVEYRKTLKTTSLAE